MVRSLVMLLAFLSLLPRMAAAGAPESIIELEDPPGDADGPGGYSPPSDSELSADDFDLRKFVVRVEGDDVVFEVTIGGAIHAPGTPQRTNSTPVEFNNGIYYQNIDIYIDTDRSPGSGFAACIPGRRVAFADGRTWERAVVLTPQPAMARAVVQASLPEAAPFVSIPGPLTIRGRRIIARIPIAQLGGRPKATWGWSVQLSGAAWERNFALVKTVIGSAAADALTLPVETTADRYAFGGSAGGHSHPQVMDIIVPRGVDQHQVLSTFNDSTGDFARVPFVYGEPPPVQRPMTEASPPPPAPELRVADVAGELISIEGSVADLKPMMIGSVLEPNGTTLARVVIVQVVARGIVASALENKEKITRGAVVRFTTKPSLP